MIDKVSQTIRKYDMIPHGSRVLVALSGGSDSVTLLHVLLSLKESLSIEIEAAHVNHCLRGEEADSDEQFVSDLCGKYGVELHVLRADVASIAGKEGLSVEEAGRRVRYDYFRSLCPGGVIATAHNLNDRIETFLFNFSRGSSLNGLCSIPPVRDNIVRPLIECTKDEILGYCAANSLAYVTDRTNADTEYSRNRIRHNVITELMKINGGFEHCAGRCIDSLNEDAGYLKSVSCAALDKSTEQNGYSIREIASLHNAVKTRVVSMMLEKEGLGEINAKLISEICSAIDKYDRDGTGTVVQLPESRFLRTRAGIVEFPGEMKTNSEVVILRPGNNYFGNYVITVSEYAGENFSQIFNNDLSVFFGNSDNISGDISARKRLPGDRIRYLKGDFSKSLRKIQNEKAVPPEIRDEIPVIADSEGLLCAFGCGIDARFMAGKQTDNIIKIEIKRMKQDAE